MVCTDFKNIIPGYELYRPPGSDLRLEMVTISTFDEAFDLKGVLAKPFPESLHHRFGLPADTVPSSHHYRDLVGVSPVHADRIQTFDCIFHCF